MRRPETLVSIVIPCWNEAPGLGRLHAALCAALDRQAGVRFEFLFVDDGSTDATLATLIGLAALDPRVRVLELSRNFGKEAALTAGLDHAAGAAVIPLDADLQDPPGLIPAMLAAWREGADVVLARRADRAADSALKRGSARLFYKLHNRLAAPRLPEDVGDFRLMDRAVVEALKALPENQRFMKGLFAWVGFRTVTLDYARPARAAGASRFSGLKLWNLALDGIAGFSTAPLKVWTYLGAALAASTLCYALYIVLRTLVRGADVPGYASLLVAVLFLGSLQLVSIGLLGEYIGRIHLESKRRPPYLVRRDHRPIAEEPWKPAQGARSFSRPARTARPGAPISS